MKKILDVEEYISLYNIDHTLNYRFSVPKHKTDIYPLMKSIASCGWDTDSTIYINMAKEGHVLSGNRRLLALQLLSGITSYEYECFENGVILENKKIPELINKFNRNSFSYDFVNIQAVYSKERRDSLIFSPEDNKLQEPWPLEALLKKYRDNYDEMTLFERERFSLPIFEIQKFICSTSAGLTLTEFDDKLKSNDYFYYKDFKKIIAKNISIDGISFDTLMESEKTSEIVALVMKNQIPTSRQRELLNFSEIKPRNDDYQNKRNEFVKVINDLKVKYYLIGEKPCYELYYANLLIQIEELEYIIRSKERFTNLKISFHSLLRATLENMGKIYITFLENECEINLFRNPGKKYCADEYIKWGSLKTLVSTIINTDIITLKEFKTKNKDNLEEIKKKYDDIIHCNKALYDVEINIDSFDFFWCDFIYIMLEDVYNFHNISNNKLL